MDSRHQWARPSRSLSVQGSRAGHAVGRKRHAIATWLVWFVLICTFWLCCIYPVAVAVIFQLLWCCLGQFIAQSSRIGHWRLSQSWAVEQVMANGITCYSTEPPYGEVPCSTEIQSPNQMRPPQRHRWHRQLRKQRMWERSQVRGLIIGIVTEHQPVESGLASTEINFLRV